MGRTPDCPLTAHVLASLAGRIRRFEGAKGRVVSTVVSTSPVARDEGASAAAERALWRYYGLEPTERFVEISAPSLRLRILEIGSGPPILFVHGTVGPGSWVPLVRELDGFRCLVLDRPGWGVSDSLDFAHFDYGTVVADILKGVLDALNLERAHVVGNSIGDVWVLRLAERHPDRVDRVGLLGAGPVVPGVGVPRPIKLIATPVGALMPRLMRQPRVVRNILRGAGHQKSLEDGRIPDAFIDWRVTLVRESDSMQHERAMVQTIVSRRGYSPQLTFTDAELETIAAPTLIIVGGGEHVGTPELWRQLTGLLPDGKFRLVEQAGHIIWFDEPELVAGELRQFLNAREEN